MARADHFGDLITAEYKILSKKVNRETIIDMQSWWSRTWPLNGSSRVRAKHKLLRKQNGACKSSWSGVGSLKSFTLTIFWNCSPVWITNGGRIPWNVTAICETFKDKLSDGKTFNDRLFGMLFDGPVIPFGAMVEHQPFIIGRILERIHFGRRQFRIRADGRI